MVLIVALSGCTTNDSTKNNSTSKTSTYAVYNNSVMSFQYPDNWVLDFVSSDSKGVYFNSSHGEIRIQIYSSSTSTGQTFETVTIGNKSYKLYNENNNNIYVITLPNGNELLVRGPVADNDGLKKVLETFKLV